MASLLSPRRSDRAIALEARVAPSAKRRPTRHEAASPQLGWLPVAVAAGLLSSLAGWALIAGTVVLGWLSAEPGTFSQSLETGTRLWLLSNGVGARLGATTLTLIPWGATAVSAFLVFRSAAFAARRAGRGTHIRRAAIATITASAFLAPVVVGAVVMGNSSSSLSRLPVVGMVIWLAAVWGAGRAGDAASAGWLAWTAAIAGAVIGAQLTMAVAGAALLATGLFTHFDRVVALTAGLDAGIAGGIALLILQLAFGPNAVIWAGSYALGAGFSVGTGSVVAPAGTELGMLPSLPFLGALPAGGAADVAELWWLVSGVTAGAVAAWIVVRQRPIARLDQTSLVGGLSGLLAGLIFVCVAWASGGDLGTLRLTDLGPRLEPLLVMAPTTMGLAGMVVGFALGLLRIRWR
jgi:Family of unknown function (DUF6350)